MVGRITFLVVLAAAGLALLACSGGQGGAASAPTSRPSSRPTAVATALAAGPHASIEPSSGPPGTRVTITGAGWAPNAKVDVMGAVARGETPPTYESVTTDAQGGFVVSFRLEKGANGSDLAVGRFDVIAKSSTDEVDMPFLVETRRPVPSNGPGG